MKYFQSHLLHYLILAVLFLMGGLTVILVPSLPIKWVVIIGLALTYLTWGIWHHYQEHELNKETIFEYLGIIALVVIVLLMVSSS